MSEPNACYCLKLCFTFGTSKTCLTSYLQGLKLHAVKRLGHSLAQSLWSCYSHLEVWIQASFRHLRQFESINLAPVLEKPTNTQTQFSHQAQLIQVPGISPSSLSSPPWSSSHYYHISIPKHTFIHTQKICTSMICTSASEVHSPFVGLQMPTETLFPLSEPLFSLKDKMGP